MICSEDAIQVCLGASAGRLTQLAFNGGRGVDEFSSSRLNSPSVGDIIVTSLLVKDMVFAPFCFGVSLVRNIRPGQKSSRLDHLRSPVNQQPHRTNLMSLNLVPHRLNDTFLP